MAVEGGESPAGIEDDDGEGLTGEFLGQIAAGDFTVGVADGQPGQQSGEPAGSRCA